MRALTKRIFSGATGLAQAPRNCHFHFPLTMKSHRLVPALAAALVCTVPHAAFSQQSGVQSLAEQQIRQQEQMATYAQQAVDKGNVALANQDYESAYAWFKSAVDVLPSGGEATAKVRASAMDGFSKACVKLAEQRISEGRYQDAETVITVILDDRYNPNYKPALVLQKNLATQGRYNKSITPGFVASVEEVKQLLTEAEGFYQSGRFDLATKRYEQVLNIDKYNIAARRGMERVDLARQQYQDSATNEARSDMIRQVDKGWELPVRKFDVGATSIIDQPPVDTRGTSAINRKLDDIIVPRIEFRDATIREALDFLRQRAAALDTSEDDPTRKGVNLVLKVPEDSPEANARITLALTDVPLRAAIQYVANAASLKLKVEPYAVVIVLQSEPTDVLITKEYKVPPSFITALPATDATAGAAAGGGGQISVAPGSLPAIAERSGARQFLEASGVTFPQGASANFIASASKLIVKNTQANLDLIDTLVETAIAAPPAQVEIEAKFLEITQTNLKELGFDWLLGQFALPGGTGVYGGGGTQGFNQSINANAYPLQSSVTGVPIGANSTVGGPVTAGNRSGNFAIKGNAVDALLFGGTPLGPAPAVLALAGVFTNPQFQLVIRALDQKKGVDLVSAPKVTTKSGQRATIEIVREFRYPSEYDLPQITQTPGAVFTPVTPTSPTAFETKPVGIVLEVDPTVGPDGYTIDLVLSPRVVEFEGFINYGSPISTVATITQGSQDPITGFFTINAFNQNILVTENVINQPVFSSREVTTQVTVYDGATVVLGGLLREDIQQTEDKVPILGDIPIAGRLFRTTADQHIKRNLIMFVTASLLDPAGQPLVKTDDENQVVPEPSARKVEQEILPGDATSIPLPQ